MFSQRNKEFISVLQAGSQASSAYIWAVGVAHRQEAGHPFARKKWPGPMVDLLMLIGLTAAFAVAWLYVMACSRLVAEREPGSEHRP